VTASTCIKKDDTRATKKREGESIFITLRSDCRKRGFLYIGRGGKVDFFFMANVVGGLRRVPISPDYAPY